MSDPAGTATGTVSVEVFSDVVCPWCLIGRTASRTFAASAFAVGC